MPTTPTGAESSYGGSCTDSSVKKRKPIVTDSAHQLGIRRFTAVCREPFIGLSVSSTSTSTKRTFVKKETREENPVTRVRRVLKETPQTNKLKQISIAVEYRRQFQLQERERLCKEPSSWRTLEEYPKLPSIEKIDRVEHEMQEMQREKKIELIKPLPTPGEPGTLQEKKAPVKKRLMVK